MKENHKKRFTEFGLDDSAKISGGRLWPFFDVRKIVSEIYYGEDLFFKDLFKE